MRVPPPVLVAAVMAAAWGLHRLAPLPLGGALPWLGAAWIAAGAALAAWAIATMVRGGTDPRPDKPDAALQEGGPFRHGRNPVYVGFLLVAIGLAVAWGDAWGWVGVVVAFAVLDRLVVAREEAYLRTRFGAAYSEYAGRVRRWL